MSNLAFRDGTDFPEAAKKHLNDAHVLLGARRYVGAAYLSGYAVECSLKTLLLLELFAQQQGLSSIAQLATQVRLPSASTFVANIGRGSAVERDLFKLGHKLDMLIATASGAITTPPGPATGFLASSVTSRYHHRGWAKLTIAGRQAWGPELRYKPPTAITARTAARWYKNAAAVLGRSVAAMWADGVVY